MASAAVLHMPMGSRYISDIAKVGIDTLVEGNDLVVFMKGTPDAPQCGFSRTVYGNFDTI